MLDAPSPGGNASQPDVYLGSQPGIGQLVDTSTNDITWPPVSAVAPANPYTSLIIGSAGPKVSYNAPPAQWGALLRPVKPGQQPGLFYFSSMSADLRPDSAPGYAHGSLPAATTHLAPVQATPLSIGVPGSLAGGITIAQEPVALQPKKRNPNIGSELYKAIADVSCLSRQCEQPVWTVQVRC